MRTLALLIFVHMAGCGMDPEVGPDAPVPLTDWRPIDAPLAIPPEPMTCACTTVGPSESDNMALPFSANTNYEAGSQVKSADLDDLQAQIVALYLGARALYIPAAAGQATTATFAFLDGQQYFEASGAGGITVLPVSLLAAGAGAEHTGDRITKVEVFIENTTTTAQTAALMRKEMGGAGTVTVGSASGPAASGNATITIDLSGSPEEVTGNNQWWIKCTMAATGNRVRGARVTYDRNTPP